MTSERYIFNKQLHDTLLNTISELQPTHHITLTWDTNHRPRSIEKLKDLVRDYMVPFENEIASRNWFRHPYKFIMFIETHADNTLHAHILFNGCEMTTDNINDAFYYMRRKAFANYPIPFITEICDKTSEYVLKQMKSGVGGTIDTSCYITSDELFGSPPRKKRHRKVKGYEKYNMKVKNTIGDYEPVTERRKMRSQSA